MRLFRFIRDRKPPSERELQQLYRSAEEGSPLPDVGAEVRAKFEADQHLSGQISDLASSAGPTNTPLQRGVFLSRVADEARRRPMEKGIPVFGHLFQMRTLAAGAAAVVLLGAVATVGAAGGAGQIADNAEDILVALQISSGSPKVDVCHVPDDNPDNTHTISVSENAVEEHLAHGDSAGVCDDDTPPGRPDDVGPSDSVDVCHNARTLSVSEDAVEEHLAHGDSEGACNDDTTPGPTDTVGPSDRVDVCHNARTLSVPEDAVEEHLDHGDSEGVCDDETPPGPPDDVGPSDRVAVCHDTRTLSVPENAAEEHFAHGDSEGACTANGDS